MNAQSAGRWLIYKGLRAIWGKSQCGTLHAGLSRLIAPFFEPDQLTGRESMPLHNNRNAVAKQLSPHCLSRDLPPVLHLSTRPILGRVTRACGAALGAREES